MGASALNMFQLLMWELLFSEYPLRQQLGGIFPHMCTNVAGMGQNLVNIAAMQRNTRFLSFHMHVYTLSTFLSLYLLYYLCIYSCLHSCLFTCCIIRASTLSTFLCLYPCLHSCLFTHQSWAIEAMQRWSNEAMWWSVKRFIASISLPALNASSLHCFNFLP